MSTKTIKSSGGDYSSLSAWEAAQNGDLVAAGEIREAICYAFTDTSVFVVDGGTANSSFYLKVSADASGRHNGIPGSGYKNRQNTNNDVFYIADDYCWIDGIEIDASATGVNGIRVLNTGVKISNCLVHTVSSITNGRIIWSTTDSITWYAWNNICYDNTAAGSFTGGIYYDGTGTLYSHNNTVYGCNRAFYRGSGTVEVINCLGVGGADNFTGTFTGSSNYNCSDVASDAPGANSQNGSAPTFVNTGTKDFHLGSSDTVAHGKGTDLSGDTNPGYTNDIDNTTITGTWDIGADWFAAAGGATRGAPFGHRGTAFNGGRVLHGIIK